MQRLSVAHVNAAFPKYPITVDDKGWVYGVWYCGTGWQKVILHGQYPPGFLKRALALFPDARDILHAPSGTLGSEWGTTVDLVRDDVRKPMFQASVAALPFPDNSFDLWISDPPYTDADSKKYGTPPFPMRAMMKEARRVVRGGGHLGVLHRHYPSFRRQEWKLVGLISVVTGAQRMTRIFSIFRNLKEE